MTPFGDESTVLDPATFGFAGEPLPKFSKEEQLALLKALLTGKKADNALRPIIEHVIFNAGLRLYWFDKVSSYEEGFQLAESLLKRGEASRVLWEWVEMGRSPAGEGRKAE